MAEPTYEDVMGALRAADAAGDTEGATRLAQMAASLKAAPAKEAPEDDEAGPVTKALINTFGPLVRSVAKGGGALPNFASDVLSKVGNLAIQLQDEGNEGLQLIPKDTQIPTLGEAQSRALDSLNYKGVKIAPVSDNPVVRTAQNALEGTIAAATTGGLSSLPQMASAAVGSAVAPPVAEKVANVTGYDALGQIAGMAAGALTGGVTGKGVAAATAERPKYLSLDEIKKEASKAYKTVDDSGLTVKRSSLNTMLADIDKELAAARFDPRIGAQKDVGAVVTKLKELARDPNVPVTLSKLDDLRKWAGDLRTNADGNVQRLGKVLIESIDNHVANLNPQDFYTGGKAAPDVAIKALMDARTFTRNRARGEILDDAIEKAEVNSNKDNASKGKLLRDALINIEANKKTFSMFNEQEQNAIKSFNRGGPADKTLAFIAKFNPQRNALVAGGLGGGGATAFMSGNTGTAALLGGTAAAGYGVDKLQGYLRSKGAQRVVDRIANQRFAPPTEGYSPQGLFGGGVTAQDAVEMQRLFGGQ